MKTLEQLLKSGAFFAGEKEEAIEELFVRLPSRQKEYWTWTNLETENMELLEKLMRQWDEALELLRGKHEVKLEYEIAAMHFELLNTRLFYQNEMFAEAKEELENAANSAKSILRQLKEENRFEDREFHDYALQEGWRSIMAMYQLCELNLRLENGEEALHQMECVLDEFKTIKGYLISRGEFCAESVYLLFRSLYEFQRFGMGNADFEQVMELDKAYECLKEQKPYSDFDRAVLGAVKMLLDMFRGIAFFAESQFAGCGIWFDSAAEDADWIVELLQEQIKNGSEWMESFGADLIRRLCTIKLSAVFLAGQCAYFEGNLDKAKKQFKRMLDFEHRYQNEVPKMSRLRTKSQVYAMLGDICTREGDHSQAEFYLDQNEIISGNIAKASGALQDWNTYVHGCLFAMEHRMGQKKMEEAKKHAESGLLACQEVRRLFGNPEVLQLETKFEKALRKKRGIFSRWF